MTSLNSMIIFGWGAICAVWQGLLIFQYRVKDSGMMVSPVQYKPSDQKLPTVTVIIPACNEEETILDSLRCVQAQDYPHLNILVVDDRSTDRTLELVKMVAVDDARISTLQIKTLPKNWLGKSHAMWKASEEINTEWMLFIDSDCQLHASAITTTVTKALKENADLLTLWPKHDARSFWEHMLIPLCGGIIALWFSNSTITSTDNAFVNGQFLLIQAEAYRRIGGHESVKLALIEDIPFAEHARKQGLTSTIIGGRDLARVRMYDGFLSIWNGWARIYVGALRSGIKLTLSILWLLFGSLLPYVVVGSLATHAVVTQSIPPIAISSPWWLAMFMATQHLCIMMVVSYRFWGMGHCKRKYLWLYPISVLVVSAIVCQAIWWLLIRKSVLWRTTRYTINRKGMIQQC